jgi:sigma-B regulation protein RsbU (phosphoserine phosphatase)
MNKKNLLSQLNIIHIAFSGVLILVLFISTLLFNYWQIVKTSETNKLINLENHFEAIDWEHFFFYALACLILFLLSVFLINLINSQLTSPFTEMVSSIKRNDRFKTDRLTVEKDYELIGKYIRNIENQLNFYEKKFEQITTEKKGLENDLKLASRLQKNLFPANTPLLSDHKKFEIYAYTDSAYDVGGDLYDCFLIDDDHLLIAIADVAGKGIAASLYMIYTHTLLRSLVKPGSSVTEIIEQLNNKLIEENISDMFVTIFLGILNLTDGEFEYCNAAHSLPCMITAKGSVFELPETHGIPVGIYPDRIYQSSKILLDEDDQLFLYTDGLTDSIDENGLKYSMDVLKYNLMGAWFFTASEVVERIKKSVEYFRGNNKAVDDITLLSFKYYPSNHQVD